MRVVFVHGSVGNGPATFTAIEPLRGRFEVVVPNRGGYPPGPLLDRIDFEEQAEELAPLLGDGAHLVGHSYGGVIALLMAARAPEAVRSLTVSEPPAFGVARGQAEVDRLIAELETFFAAGPHEPADYLSGFLAIVGSAARLPDPLPPELEQGARTLMAERGPWEADVPVQELAARRYPKLVVSGGHHPLYDLVCDEIAAAIGAETAVLPGAGHSVARAPGFNERLRDFLGRAETGVAPY